MKKRKIWKISLLLFIWTWRLFRTKIPLYIADFLRQERQNEKSMETTVCFLRLTFTFITFVLYFCVLLLLLHRPKLSQHLKIVLHAVYYSRNRSEKLKNLPTLAPRPAWTTWTSVRKKQKSAAYYENISLYIYDKKNKTKYYIL